MPEQFKAICWLPMSELAEVLQTGLSFGVIFLYFNSAVSVWFSTQDLFGEHFIFFFDAGAKSSRKSIEESTSVFNITLFTLDLDLEVITFLIVLNFLIKKSLNSWAKPTDILPIGRTPSLGSVDHSYMMTWWYFLRGVQNIVESGLSHLFTFEHWDR